jgi:hypothetical protein
MSTRNRAGLAAGSGIDAIVGIWEKWRFDRLGSRGDTKNIFRAHSRIQVFDFIREQKMTPRDLCAAASPQNNFLRDCRSGFGRIAGVAVAVSPHTEQKDKGLPTRADGCTSTSAREEQFQAGERQAANMTFLSHLPFLNASTGSIV